MDLTESIIPRSDQLNAEDFLTGPRTVTVTEVSAGNAEQPVNVHVAEFPDRPFKPSKSMRRVLVAAWGKESSAYVGRRMTLYRDPTVRFGGQDVGGIRISHMSHLDKRLTLALTVTRGKRAPYIVEPLADQPAAPAGATEAELKALLGAYQAAGITDRGHMLRFAAETVGRPIASATDLTSAEAATVAAALQPAPADEAPPPVDESAGDAVDDTVWPAAAVPGGGA